MLIEHRQVYHVHRIVRVGATHYLLLALIAPMRSVDAFDQMVAQSATPEPESFRIISLSNATDITALWAFPLQSGGLRVQPKW